MVLGQNDKVAYTSNTKTGSISAYTVSSRGELALIGDGRSVVTGADSKPTDMALSRDERFLFVLESGTHGIASIRLRGDGSLSVVSNLAGLPASAAGLVSQ